MNTWTPMNVILVVTVCSVPIGSVITAIIFAIRNNAVGAKDALEAAARHAATESRLNQIQAQIQQLSLLTPSPLSQVPLTGGPVLTHTDTVSLPKS